MTSNTTGFWCGAVMIRISSSGATSSAIRPYLRRTSDRASGSSASTSSVRSCRKYAGYRGAGKSKPSIFGSGGLARSEMAGCAGITDAQRFAGGDTGGIDYLSPGGEERFRYAGGHGAHYRGIVSASASANLQRHR